MRKITLLSICLAALWAQVSLAQTADTTHKAAPAQPTPAATTPVPASTSAMGEKVKKGSIYVGGGVSMPMSPSSFSDNWDMGFHGGLGLGYMVKPNLELGAWGNYHTFALKDLPAGFDGGDFTSIEVTANVKFVLMTNKEGAKLHPYLAGGVGMASLKFTELDSGSTVVVAEESTSELTFNAGGGVEIAVSPTAAIFVEARYTSVSTEGESSAYVPIKAGLKLTVF